MLWWKIVRTQAYFQSGTVDWIIFVYYLEVLLSERSLKSAGLGIMHVNFTVGNLSREQRSSSLPSSHFCLLNSQLFGKALFSYVSVQENEISNTTETETPTIDVGLYE